MMYARVTLLNICLLLLSAHQAAHAQQVVTVKQGSVDKEILVLPYYPYTFDSTLVEKEPVNTGRMHKGKAKFTDQLSAVALKTAEAGGNVFMLTKVEDRNQRCDYKIWGRACRTDKYDALKAKALSLKEKLLENGRYAYIVLYRPEYAHGFDDEADLVLTVNDTMHLEMKASSKYIVQVPVAGDVKITNKNDVIVQHVDVKPGNVYYLRAYTKTTGKSKFVKVGESNVEIRGHASYFERIDNAQGELESSLVTKITVMKKLGN